MQVEAAPDKEDVSRGGLLHRVQYLKMVPTSLLLRAELQMTCQELAPLRWNQTYSRQHGMQLQTYPSRAWVHSLLQDSPISSQGLVHHQPAAHCHEDVNRTIAPRSLSKAVLRAATSSWQHNVLRMRHLHLVWHLLHRLGSLAWGCPTSSHRLEEDNQQAEECLAGLRLVLMPSLNTQRDQKAISLQLPGKLRVMPQCQG
mmetsp:Transcript_123528/g.226692  ORF Transcript_123528/g.226692 Transcript_123528/m.226692 type:complete len:200 (-) Transcript_123528:13-612(-)